MSHRRETHQRLLCGSVNMYDSVYMYSSALIKSCLKSLHRLGPRFAQPLNEILTEFIDS